MSARSSTARNVTDGVAERAAPRTVKKRGSGGVLQRDLLSWRVETLRKKMTKHEQLGCTGEGQDL